MPALGKMEPIIQAAGVAAGMGVVLWMIVQSISQLMEAYGEKNAKTLLNNAAVKQFLGFDDQDDPEKVSAMIGDATFVGTSRSETSGDNRQALDLHGGANSSTNISVQKVKRRLMTADQLLALDDATMTLKFSNTRPSSASNRSILAFRNSLGFTMNGASGQQRKRRGKALSNRTVQFNSQSVRQLVIKTKTGDNDEPAP